MTVYLLLGFAVPFVEENFLMLALLDVTSMAYSDQVPNTAIIKLCFDNVEWSCGNFSTRQSYDTKLAFATYIVHPIGSLSFVVHIEQP